ncbi:MAG: ATP-binding protein [Pseudomonadota bacterium]
MTDDSTRAGARTTTKFAVFVMLGFLVATGLGLSAAQIMIDRSVKHFQNEVLVAKADAAVIAIDLLAEQEMAAIGQVIADLSDRDLSQTDGDLRPEIAAMAIFDRTGRLLMRGDDFPEIYMPQAGDLVADLIGADAPDGIVLRPSVVSTSVLYGLAAASRAGDIGVAVAIRTSPTVGLGGDQEMKIVETAPYDHADLAVMAGDRMTSVYRPMGFGTGGLILSMPEDMLAERREAIQIVVSIAMIIGLFAAFLLIFIMGRRLILRPFAELRLSREMLRRSETDARRLVVAVEAASDHIMISDSEGILLWVNQAMIDGTGYARSDLIGRRASEVLFGDGTPEEVRRLVVETRARREKTTFRSFNYKKSGEPYVADVSLTPILSDDGEDVSYVAIERNATETHIAEERLKNAVDAMNDGFAIVGADGRYRIMNAAFRKQINAYGVRIEIGDSYDEMIKRLAASGSVNTEHGDREGWAAEKIASFRSAKSKEFYTTDPYGVTVLRRQRRLPSGETVFLATNVTELNEARARAVEAMEAKSRFTASISHELRTPLNGMISMSELLLKGDMSQSDRSGVELIHQSGIALLDIINDILDFSKIEAGRLEIRPEPFDIVSGLEDITALMTPAASAKELTLLFRFDPEAPRHLVGDLGRIRQIVTNLVGNAIKFTDVGRIELRLGLRRTDGRAEILIEVEDTGYGIGEDDLIKIFAPFEQARNQAAVRAQEGTGLGLSICRDLAMIMGGHLSARSTLGSGSIFCLTLEVPIADATGPGQISKMEDRAPVSDVAVALHADQHLGGALSDQLRSIGATIIEDQGDERSEAVAMRFVVLDDQAQITGTVPLSDAPLIIVAPHTNAEPCPVAQGYMDNAARVLRRPVRTRLLRNVVEGLLDDARRRVPEAELASAPPAIGQPPRHARNATDAALPLIVAAEDNPTNSFILQAMLKDAPFRLVIQPDAGSALAAIEAERPSVVLMDLHLPDMTGADATVELRRREAAMKLPPVTVLGYTAGMTEAEEAECMVAGMDDIIIKPVTRDDLIARLTAALPDDLAAAG